MKHLAALLILLPACSEPTKTEAPRPPTVRDAHSYSNPDEVRVVHLALELDTSFEKKELAARATLTLDRTAGKDALVLDSRDLVIDAVTDASGPLTYELGAADPILGAPLRIKLGPTTQKLTVQYRTKPEAPALQWLTPAQTAGKQQPFLFTQGQAILTRTWIPIQDSPGVRFTYEATVRVPEKLRAVMSARAVGASTTEGGISTYRFTMPERIPAYLVALAVGDLATKPLGARTAVWAEPSVLEAAAYEFADTEAMLETAERLYGPYRWERYDLLILPPSFPFGGMENPRLTFASPTAIAGDRSLASLVAHELAHSWSGNLVTNATWADFWLNEGTTTYFENRIVEVVYGKQRADLENVLGWQDLQEELAEMSDPKLSKLWREVNGEDPDDGITGIPYTKGSSFFRHLETSLGRERFDAFLRAYFERHAFQSMTTQRFVELVKTELLQGDAALYDKLEIEAWVYGSGMPKGFVPPTSTLLDKVDADLKQLATGAAPEKLDTKSYGALEWVHFVKNLPRPLPAGKLAALDKAFLLSSTKNSEIRFEWLKLAVQSGYQAAVPSLEDYLLRQGRRRLVLPLYEELSATEWGRPVAARIFEKARPFYHPLTAGSVAEVLAPKG